MTNKKPPQNKLAAIKAKQLQKDPNCYAQKKTSVEPVAPANTDWPENKRIKNNIRPIKESLFKRIWQSLFSK